MNRLRVNRTRLAIIIFVGVILLGITWMITDFIKTHERLEKQVREGVSQAVISNRFYAAQALIQKMGRSAEVKRGFTRLIDLPDYYDVIIARDIGQSLSDAQQMALLEWVEMGGRLITVARERTDSDNTYTGNVIADRFHISRQSFISNADDNPLVDEIVDTLKPLIDKGTAIAKIDEGTLSVAFSSWGTLVQSVDKKDVTVPKAEVIVSKGDNVYGFRIPIGGGDVLVFSSLEFMRNPPHDSFLEQEDVQSPDDPGIKAQDNAYYLWALVKDYEHTWILPDYDADALNKILWARAPLFIISFLVLVVFALWAMRNRFGPDLPEIDPPRRDIMEHIRMTASHAWRMDSSRLLLLANRARVTQLLLRKHPYLKPLNPAERIQKMHQMWGLPMRDIESALYISPKDATEFIACSHQLQILRNTL